MSTQSITQSYPIFTDIDGSPLESGRIYIGTAGLPAATNQITVYWDAALTTPAAQPIMTTGGYPMNSGSPGNLYTDAVNYSIAVNNKNNSAVTSSLNVTDGFTSSLTGAVPRTVNSKLGDFVSVLDFGAVADGSTDDSAAIQAAIDSLALTGGQVFFPAGIYYSASTITIATKNITLTGAGNAMAYEGSLAGTRIVFGSQVVGIDITSVDNYACVEEMELNGNGNCQYPIKVYGTSTTLQRLNVTGSTAAGAGIWLTDFINQVRVIDVSSGYNNGFGILIGGAGAVGNTILSIDHCSFRRNKIGMRIEQATHVAITNTVIESNFEEGLVIYKPTGLDVSYLNFDTVWVENNNLGTTNYDVVIDSETRDFAAGPANYIRFVNCMINSQGTVKAIDVQSVRALTFENQQFAATAAIDLGTYASYVVFKDRNGGVITDNGNRNYELDSDRSLAGGLRCDKPIVQPTPSSYYTWSQWNPSDVVGTTDNAPATALASSINNTFCSVANVSGTLTVTFAIPGTYRVDTLVTFNASNVYTLSRAYMNFGGTATRSGGRTQYSTSGDSVNDINFALTIPHMITVSAANQTLTLLPQSDVTAGGTVGQYNFVAEASWTYLGS